MSTYTFSFKHDISGTPDVTVVYDDTESPFIEDVLSAFEQFLLGVTFQPASIREYLDTQKILDVRCDMARRVGELKEALALNQRIRNLAAHVEGR